MLTFYFNHKAHTNFQNYISVHDMFFSYILTSNLRQFDVKLKFMFKSIFIWYSYRRFQPLQRNTQYLNVNSLGVISTSRYKLNDSCEKTVRHFVTSLWRWYCKKKLETSFSLNEINFSSWKSIRITFTPKMHTGAQILTQRPTLFHLSFDFVIAKTSSRHI